MTSIQRSNQVTRPDCGDNTAPPQPQVIRSIAFERASEDATLLRNVGGNNRPAGRDPAYFELGNVEVGTKIQFINMSAKPDADWETKRDVLELTMTGRDVNNRQASFYLTNDQMDELGLKPGDMLQMRAVDQSGNASAAVTTELEPNDWATHTVRDRENDRMVDSRGTQLSALDGEGERQNLILKTVNDNRPPTVVEKRLSLVLDDRFGDDDKKLMGVFYQNWNTIQNTLGKNTLGKEDLKTLEANEEVAQPIRDAAKALLKNDALYDKMESARTNGQTDGTFNRADAQAVVNFKRTVYLRADKAVEPRATVNIQNQRTGKEFSVRVGDDRKINLPLGDVRDGDPLIMHTVDNEQQRGKDIELVFSCHTEGGIAKRLQGGIATRLPGVL